VQEQVLAQRYIITATILLSALLAAHIWLPNGKLRIRDVLPGVLITMIFWVVAASLFAWYLSHFASYATTYAGFAAVMVALVFLYFLSVIFILGGELNSAWQRSRKAEVPPPGPTMLPIDA
jgi:membrane protein